MTCFLADAYTPEEFAAQKWPWSLRQSFKCFMKRAQVVCLSLILAAAFPLPGSLRVGPGGRVAVQIRKIEPSKVKTPEYQLQGPVHGDHARLVPGRGLLRNRADWIDDLTFTYYVLMKPKTARLSTCCSRGDVTYVNIQKGKHKSDMYLHLEHLARYGDVQQVAVVLTTQGRVVAMESLPASQQRWWEQLTPMDGYVLNRMQTPFAMINFDDYEAIKPSGPGGR